jgi:hypothetical protein
MFEWLRKSTEWISVAEGAPAADTRAAADVHRHRDTLGAYERAISGVDRDPQT